jgi:hypothetical protein
MSTWAGTEFGKYAGFFFFFFGGSGGGGTGV